MATMRLKLKADVILTYIPPSPIPDEAIEDFSATKAEIVLAAEQALNEIGVVELDDLAFGDMFPEGKLGIRVHIHSKGGEVWPLKT